MASGAAKARAKLKYAAEQYTPWSLHQWPERQLRQEYTRLRDIAVKRLKRISREPSISSDPGIDYWSSQTPKLSTLVSRLEIEDALANLAIFVANPEISTVGGIRARQKKQQEAFKKLTGETYYPSVMSIRDWFGYMQSEGLLELYASEDIVEFYYDAQGKRDRLNADSFRAWLEDRDYWDDLTAGGPDPDSGSDMF